MFETENELKNEEVGEPNWKAFGIGIATIFCFILFIMLVGSLLLYTIKLGASNVLPTNISSDNISGTQPIKVTANVLREFSYHGLNIFNAEKVTSQKLTFNSLNLTFSKLAQWFGPGFFGSLVDKMLSFNNIFINNLGSLLNGLNESVLIFFSGIIYPILVSIYFVFNWFFLFFDQFIEFADYLTNNFWIPTIFSYLIELLFCLPLIAIFSIIASILSIFTVLYSFFIIPFGYATYDIKDGTSKNSFRQFFTDSFKYKTTFMSVLFSILMLFNVSSSLGFVYAALFLFILGISIHVFDIFKTTIVNLDEDQTPGIIAAAGLTYNFMGGKGRMKKLHIV